MEWQESNDKGRTTDRGNYKGNEGVSAILFDSAYGFTSSDRGNNFDPQRNPHPKWPVGKTDHIDPQSKNDKSESEGKSNDKSNDKPKENETALDIKKRSEHWANLLQQARKDPDLYDTAATKVVREMASLNEGERQKAMIILNNELTKRGMADRVGIMPGSVDQKNGRRDPDLIYFVRSDGTVVKKAITDGNVGKKITAGS